MYSKKVLKIFENPEFVGEIKNPDAVGQVGNKKCGDVMRVYLKVDKKTNKIKDIKFKTYGCFPPEEKIVLPNEWKSISELSNSNIVLNENGEETKIKKIIERNYEGKLLKFIPFVSPHNSFYITPEHPIFCIKRKEIKGFKPNAKSWIRFNQEELLSKDPEYKEAFNLEVGDYLVFSYNKQIKDKKKYSKSFLRLIGYYLAEGYISAKNGAVAFAFHKNEKEYINEVKKLIKELTGKEAKSRIRKNVEEVYVNSREFVRIMLKEASKLARKKELSQEIMLLHPKKQLEIIETYFNGDGDMYRRRKNNSPTYRLATSSEKLAIQFQEILARNNIFASIRKQKQKAHKIEGRLIKGQDYIFIVSYKKERKHKFVHPTKGYFLIPIRKIEVNNYKGKVYNFEVSSNPHSYLVKGFIVHNCIAAITASNAMCKLAKGRTLDDALKITAKQITKELGELPAIKFHCSVLGTEALKKAVEDYRNKFKG